MSAFEQAKEMMMLLITVFVLIFVTIMFYIFLGNFSVGSEVDVRVNEAELVSLRAMKCIENGENLGECIKTEKYGIKIEVGESEDYADKALYDRLREEFTFSETYFFNNKFYEVFVRFKDE